MGEIDRMSADAAAVAALCREALASVEQDRIAEAEASVDAMLDRYEHADPHDFPPEFRDRLLQARAELAGADRTDARGQLETLARELAARWGR